MHDIKQHFEYQLKNTPGEISFGVYCRDHSIKIFRIKIEEFDYLLDQLSGFEYVIGSEVPFFKHNTIEVKNVYKTI